MTKLVVIDPGHGGSDPGAVWPPMPAPPALFDPDADPEAWREYDIARAQWQPEIVEKHVALAVAYEAKRAVEALSWDVACELTRDDDFAMTLGARGAFSEKLGADLVVSLHCNAADFAAQGAIGFHWPGNEQARQACEAMLEAMPERLKRARNNVFAAHNDGWLRRARAVLAPHQAPAVLLEMGFVTNADDRAAMLDPLVRAEIAQAVVAGVARYLGA